jgi:glycosyltransferase involved in cell wall biosynthesis
MRAISSAKNQSRPALETIVAVDHNPELLERLRRSTSDVRLIASTGPKGKSGALNTAIGAASGAIIAMLDDDAAADESWLEHLLAGYDNPNVLGVGGFLEPEWAVPRPAWFPSEFLWAVGCTFRGMPTRREPVRALIGANMSFWKSVFVEVGGSRAGMGPDGTELVGAARAEDTEFCFRATHRWPDREWLFEPKARVRHYVPRSRTTWSFFRSRCYVEGVSKAVLAHSVGAQKGLAMERKYATRTLPSGVLIAIAQGMLHWDLGSLARGGAIIVGLMITTAGYLRESLRLRLKN